MSEDKIISTLNKLKKKIWIDRIINSIICCVFISVLAILLVSIFSHVFPIINVLNKIVLILISGLCIGVIYGILKCPSEKDVACIGDKLGYKERFSTYIEYQNEINEVLKVFFKELEKKVCKDDVVKKYHIKIKYKLIVLSLLAIFLSLIIFFIPSTNRQLAKEKEDINREMKEEAAEIKELKKYIQENDKDEKLSDVKKEKVLNTLEKLENKLLKTYDYKDGAFDVSDAQKQLKQNYDKTKLSIEQIFKGINNEDFYYEDIDEIKNKILSDYDRNKILKNIANVKSDLNKNKIENKSELKALEDIEETIKKQNNNKKVEDVLKSYEKENTLESIKNIETNLESMKQRLLSKGKNGFEIIGGKDKVNSFMKGKNDNFDNGETTDGKFEDLVKGGKGTEFYNGNEGLGGSGKSKEAGSFKKNGSIGKLNKSTRLNQEKDKEFNIKGENIKKGNIKTGCLEKAVGIKGMNKLLSTSYIEFKKDKFKYMNRYEIPEESRQLIKLYFENLMEVN